MSEAVLDTLRDVIRLHGAEVVHEQARLAAMLRDKCPAHKRDVTCLISGLQAGVARDITSSSAVPWAVLEGRLVRNLLDHAPLTEEAARWCVRTWAVALGREVPDAAAPTTPARAVAETVPQSPRAAIPAPGRGWPKRAAVAGVAVVAIAAAVLTYALVIGAFGAKPKATEQKVAAPVTAGPAAQEDRASAPQIPPEVEIARLRMELDNLAKEDEKHFHKVATQIVEVQKLEKEVASLVKQMSDRAASIAGMREAAKGEGKFVSYAGKQFPREEFVENLRTTTAAFLKFEKAVAAKEEQLSLRKKSLETNRKKLLELKAEREEMRSDLERLQLAVEQERQEQAAANAPDDAQYLKNRDMMNEIINKIEIMKRKRILRGEADTPVRAAERKKEQDEAIDRALRERFDDEKQ